MRAPLPNNLFSENALVIFKHCGKGNDDSHYDTGDHNAGADQGQNLQVQVQSQSAQNAEKGNGAAYNDRAKTYLLAEGDTVFLADPLSVVFVQGFNVSFPVGNAQGDTNCAHEERNDKSRHKIALLLFAFQEKNTIFPRRKQDAYKWQSKAEKIVQFQGDFGIDKFFKRYIICFITLAR